MKAILLCLLAATAAAASAADKTNQPSLNQQQQLGAGPPSPATQAPAAGVDLSITVLASDAEQHPIRGANVRVSTVDGTILGEEITNKSGLIKFRGLPPGKIRIQILASGWRTYGEDISLKRGVPQTKRVSLTRP